MALWNVYLDESGSHAKAGVFAVGGYLMRSDTAKVAGMAWKSVLDDYGLDYLHMVDCAPTPPSGVHKHMSAEDRSTLVRRLIDVIKEYAAFGVCTVINPARWNPIKNTHAIAAVNTVEHLAKLVGKVDNKAKLAVFVEAGHESQALTLDALQSRVGYEPYSGIDTMPSVTFDYKGQNHLLEAADLLCWQTTKFFKDKVSGARPPRKDFLSLMEAPHAYWLMENSVENGKSIVWYRWRHPPRKYRNLETYIGGMFGNGVQADEIMKRVYEAWDKDEPPETIVLG